MQKRSVLIADDEILMCEELQEQLEQYQDLEIVAVCHDGNTALAKALEVRPDIVFLDIHMPGKSGLDVAAVLARQLAPPSVVFLTAFGEYALQAFEVNAVDYVLKPFDEMDIHRVVAKLRRLFPGKARESDPDRPPNESGPRSGYQRKFCVQQNGKLVVIDDERIKLIYAKDRLVFIQTTEDKHYNVKSTLSELEEKLDNKRFMRCHRNYIVNVDHIEHLENWFNRGYLLSLKGDAKTEVQVSKLFVKRLKEYLEFE